MRIVLLGGNGQVAAEVALRLSSADLDVVAAVRTSAGSVFLRLNGAKVLHGDVARPQEATRLLEGAGVVANFALALGTPREALERNRRIIEQSFAASPSDSTIVFFSTISVHGQYDLRGRRVSTFYGHLKRVNEKQVLAIARRTKRKAYVLRLGFVGGEYQNITQIVRQEIENSSVHLPYPDRSANLTLTADIAGALVDVASGKAGPPGVYDLVTLPNWTWREVYAHEAAHIGKPLVLCGVRQSRDQSGPGFTSKLRNALANRAKSNAVRQIALTSLGYLPERVSDLIKAKYQIASAKQAALELNNLPPLDNEALVWPSLKTRPLPGQRQTSDLLELYPLPPKVMLAKAKKAEEAVPGLTPS